MTPSRRCALIGSAVVGLPLLYLGPLLFTYLGAVFAYSAGRSLGDWARLPAAILGCLILFTLVLMVAALLGSLVVRHAGSSLK
jgi:hypothetical protein